MITVYAHAWTVQLNPEKICSCRKVANRPILGHGPSVPPQIAHQTEQTLVFGPNSEPTAGNNIDQLLVYLIISLIIQPLQYKGYYIVDHLLRWSSNSHGCYPDELAYLGEVLLRVERPKYLFKLDGCLRFWKKKSYLGESVVYPLFTILENDMECLSIKLAVLGVWKAGKGIFIQVLMPTLNK